MGREGGKERREGVEGEEEREIRGEKNEDW